MFLHIYTNLQMDTLNIHVHIILMAYMLMYVQVPYLKDQHENRTDFTDGRAGETRMGGSGGEGKGDDRVDREFRERQLELRGI